MCICALCIKTRFFSSPKSQFAHWDLHHLMPSFYIRHWIKVPMHLFPKQTISVNACCTGYFSLKSLSSSAQETQGRIWRPLNHILMHVVCYTSSASLQILESALSGWRFNFSALAFLLVWSVWAFHRQSQGLRRFCSLLIRGCGA